MSTNLKYARILTPSSKRPGRAINTRQGKLRIAQISPLWEPVPPATYGGIELIVGSLTDELVNRGHEVTLFASGDSQTSAKLESVVERSLRNEPNAEDYSNYEMLQLKRVYERANEFDIIHSHVDCSALQFARAVKTPTLHTLHNPLTSLRCQLMAQYAEQSYISISDAQREADLKYTRTVYNGIDLKNYVFSNKPQDPPYLAFLGRMSPDKGPQHAIAIAKATGLTLKLAGKVDDIHQPFFEQIIFPQLDGKQIQYLGEVNHAEKVELLGNAAATLFPITWREPFGLVMIESMATGTPVIAMNLGSVSEVIEQGKTGIICETLEEMIAAVPAALKLDRQVCRQRVERCFSVAQMVDGYEKAYQQVALPMSLTMA
jgi:glycosyltransferase involved in cell wall biosynthesis